MKFPEILPPNHIVVFGSNTVGWHGAGLAKTCVKLYGAKPGCGVGPQGNCYAIPTKQRDWNKPPPALKTMGLEEIKPYVQNFIFYAKNHPEFIFLVSPIGCGLAGYQPQDIAPLFTNAKELENIKLPKEFL